MSDSSLSELLRHLLVFQIDDISWLKPVFILLKPKLSEILSISHSLCSNCCELYTPCHVSEWTSINPELYDAEVYFFASIIEAFKDYITMDIEPYDEEELGKFRRVPTTTKEERLKQLYTVILHEDYA